MTIDRRFLLTCLIFCSIAASAVARGAGPDGERARHRFEDPARCAESWDSEERTQWQKPGVILRVLGVGEGWIVADLGAGTGYFLSYLSGLVGESGRAYAVDIEPKMLEHIRGRADLSDNVVTILAEPDDPKLPAGELDLILTVNTWHHIEKRKAYLQRLAAALKPYGRLAIVDWHAGELPMGPPPGHKLKREAVIAELREAGWSLITESMALPYQYALVFQPPGA